MLSPVPAPDKALAGGWRSEPAFVSTSGNLLADRRHAYAEAALAEGDPVAAADLFEQVLELAPHWPLAWFRLGEARERLGDPAAAADAYRRAAERDPAGVLAAGLKLAALGIAAAPETAPLAFVRGLFDQYAEKFDTHLVDQLHYRGPQDILAAIEAACVARGRAFHFDVVYDLGCGTGLMGKALIGRFDSITGIDVSPRMIDATQRSGLYNHADVADCAAFMQGRRDGSAGLVVAADVFVYIGNLGTIFAEAARVLDADGFFAFSLQRQSAGLETDYSIGADLRFAHAPAYVERLAGEHGFAVHALEDRSVRKDRGADVPGLVAVLARD